MSDEHAAELLGATRLGERPRARAPEHGARPLARRFWGGAGACAVVAAQARARNRGSADGGNFAPRKYAHLGGIAPRLGENASGEILFEEYHPFGTSSYHSWDSAAEVSPKRYRYTGKERDEETGLGYHGARYYCPWLGRWTAPDPVASEPSRYAYVRNNPVRLQDPNGLWPDGPPNERAVESTKEFVKAALGAVGKIVKGALDAQSRGALQERQAKHEELADVHNALAHLTGSESEAGAREYERKVAQKAEAQAATIPPPEGPLETLGAWLPVAVAVGTTALVVRQAVKSGGGEPHGSGEAPQEKAPAPSESATPTGGQVRVNLLRSEFRATVDERGIPLRVEGRITGPHPNRPKANPTEPVGERPAGAHRGHLVPENAVEDPNLVNVQQNMIWEAPGSNLGPKKQFEGQAAKLAAQHPTDRVAFVSVPHYRSGETTPFAVTHYVLVNGVPSLGVTIPNN